MHETNILLEHLKNIEYKIQVKANFDTAVELFKLGLIPLDDFLKFVKQYAPDVPINEESIRKQEIEKLTQNIHRLKGRAYYYEEH